MVCLLAGLSISLTSCKRQQKAGDDVVLYDLDGFIEKYNEEIDSWMDSQLEMAQKALTDEQEKALAAEGEEAQLAAQQRVQAAQRELEKYQFRKSLDGYFSFQDASAIPQDLSWVDGLDQPEIGDERAIKGGVMHDFMLAFPPTVRPFGPNSNHSFRGKMYDDFSMGLVTLHPDTMELIPGLASEWAESADGRTVYFRINPKATYSNGDKVMAKDFMTSIYVRISDHVFNPFSKQYFKEQYANITVYADDLLSVSLPEVKLMAPMYAGGLSPSNPAFYSEYGPDYKDRYQWRVPPTTGAYTVEPGGIVKGRSITLSRVKDWWAKDNQYYRYRFNTDKIVYQVIRDMNKAFELFRIGELDSFPVSVPEYWYEKTEIEPVFDGYIEKVRFYNRWPRIPWGIYLNVDEGLMRDKDVRIGMHHAMNFQKVIDSVFRGDYERLNSFSSGFGELTQPDLRPRQFSITEAVKAFERAGFTEMGADGIRRKPDGTRLSVPVTYTREETREKIMNVLKEEAKRCGFELRLDSLNGSVTYKKVLGKEHQTTYSGWGVGPPFPNYRQFFHSDQAFDDKGKRKPNTNNLNSYANPRMDELVEITRNARTVDEFKKAAYEIQQIIHDDALVIMGADRSFTSLAFWRWLKWPDSETTKFCVPVVYEPRDSYLYWIDDEVKQETLRAKRDGRKFPEVEKVYDQFREH